MAIIENFSALLNLYESINARMLIGSKVSKKEMEELRKLATICNNKTSSLKLNVEGDDADLMKSIKAVMELN